jgi:hypothetical protein
MAEKPGFRDCLCGLFGAAKISNILHLFGLGKLMIFLGCLAGWRQKVLYLRP